MKKSFLYIISAALCLSLCACSLTVESVDTPPAAKTEKTQEAAKNPETMNIVIPNVEITELMVKNHATAANAEGKYHDWVELYNYGSENAELGGFVLTDGENEQSFEDGAVIAPGEYRVVFFDKISISAGEKLSLKARNGETVTEILCPDSAADIAYAVNENGEYLLTPWATPGFENSKSGYLSFCNEKTVSSPLIINEICAANSTSALLPDGSSADWVEVKNISSAAIELSDYCLSDKLKESYSIPEKILHPGEIALIYCDNELGDDVFHVPFSINSKKDALYLTSRADGSVIDSAAVHDVPVDGSMGRMEGENGFFYFSEPTPREENYYGKRFTAAAPTSSVEQGIYDGVSSLSIELSGEGTVYYTLDGSLPTVDSAIYSEPINLESTGVIRAIAVSEDAVQSRVSSFSYIINENHTLPVMSLVTDDPNSFEAMYSWNDKAMEPTGNLTLFDGENSFSADCGIKLKGKTSLSLPKKSLAVYFRGRYGDGAVKRDLFGNGVTEFSSLAIRSGQDYTFTYIRNELCQQLAIENSASLLAQSSKYCIMYLNGQYRGIYCLKENVNEQFYASHADVSKKSVTVLDAPPDTATDLYQQVLTPAMQQDISIPENYAAIAEKLDIDAFIDWVLFEGWCANSDTQGNVKFAASTENGGRWVPVFYDLDWAFYYDSCSFNTMAGYAGNCGVELPWLVRSLMSNEEFRSKLLTRYAELISGPLSNQNVLRKIDEMASEIENEVSRDRERWGLSTDGWYSELTTLKNLIINSEWDSMTVNRLCGAFNVGEAERAQYFG